MDIEEQKLKSKKANEQKRGETAQVNALWLISIYYVSKMRALNGQWFHI